MNFRLSGSASVYCKSADDASETIRRMESDQMSAAADQAISAKDSGAPIRPDVLSRLESGMGADLGGVRVHEGPAAHDSAAALHARAFTHKSDIWLGRGESQSDLHLMAHEATHTVQQGAAVSRAPSRPAGPAVAADQASASEPVVNRSLWSKITGVAGAVWDHTGGYVVDAAGHVLGYAADLAWKVVKEVAPDWFVDFVEEVRDKGIIGYLRDKISKAFDFIFKPLRNVGSFISGVIGSFGKLIAGAREVLVALAHGDCKPLFDALSKLGSILSDAAGAVWEKIKDFFSPIGDFFSWVWDKLKDVGSFLADVAGDIWEGIKWLGQKIWDATQPVRDALGAAWDWVKDKLGLGDGDSSGSESGGGITGWIMKKLGKAWDWFSDKLQPVIGPIKSFARKIADFLPIEEILNLRQTVHEWLHHASQMVTSMRNPNGVTQNREALRDQILPAIKKSIVNLGNRITGAGVWVSGKIGSIFDSVNGFFSSLKSNSILGKLSGPIQWVQDRITDLSIWVQTGVMGLFAALGAGVAKLADFVDPVLNVLKKLVSVIGNVVKELPGLVLGPIWRAIPACIRDPIQHFVIDHILSAIPIISTFLKVPEIWSKIKNLVLDFLAQVFVKGDLSGAVMMVIRFVLEAAGVDVDLFLSTIAGALDSLDKIIMHPVQFMRNLWGALKQGFGQFKNKLGTYLIQGLVTWLVGPLEDLGVKPLKDLSLGSILELVLQVLGVSAEKIKAKAEKAIGPKAVGVLTEAWKWISALISGGLGGLWNEIQSQLSTLWETIIGGISEWLSMEVIEAAIARLIEDANPAGAIIEALRTIYKTMVFIVQKINRIIRLVNAVVQSVGKIADGVIGDAADWIERALADSVATLIAFFIDWMGIGNPAPTVHSIVEKIQGKVEAAMDWLVDKAIAIGKKIAGALGLGGDDKEEDPKWKAGVAGVSADLEKMQKDGLTEEEIQDHIASWKSTYGFTDLEVKLDGEDFDVIGAMSPKRLVAKATADNPEEGKAGTYDGLQGFKGDKLTPDHEPQHALMAYVSDLDVRRFQGFRKPFSGVKVENYTKGAGICLNMFQGRHVKTRTYGRSPDSAIGKIKSDLSQLPENSPVTKVRSTVQAVVESEMEADHTVVANIYATAKIPPAAKGRATRGINTVKDLNKQWWR